MVHELFNITNATGIAEIFAYNNSITNNMFGVGLLIVIFFVLFIGMKSYESESALASSLLITTIISYLMAAIEVNGVGLVGIEIPTALTVGLILAVLLLYRGGSSGV